MLAQNYYFAKQVTFQSINETNEFNIENKILLIYWTIIDKVKLVQSSIKVMFNTFKLNTLFTFNVVFRADFLAGRCRTKLFHY